MSENVFAEDAMVRDLSNPRATLYTFLYNLQEDSYHPELSALAFDLEDGKKAQQLAIKLKQILDGEGIYIELNEVPRQANYVDSISEKHRYTLSSDYKQIFLSKNDSVWQFSGTTVEAIPRIHKRTFPLGTDRLLNLLPNMGSDKFLGLYTWQHFGLLVLLFTGFLIHKVFSFFLKQILVKVLKRRTGQEVIDDHVLPIAKPLSLLAIGLFYLLFAPVLQLPVTVSHYLVMFLKVFVIILLARVLYRLIDFFGLYMVKLAMKTESTLDDQLVPLIRKTLKAFIFIVGALFVLDTLLVPILPLLTGLSIGGLAFALAAQDTIKNFFGSMMIFVDRPFQVGDWITSGSVDGTVEEVGLRATRVRTFRNSLVYIPNGKLADTDIDNHGLRVYRRFYTHIGITYDTPPEKIEAFVEGLQQLVLKHPHTNKSNYHVYLNEFGASSLNIMFYIFFKVPDWGGELKARNDIMLQIIHLAGVVGVRFAFPSQTLYVEEMPGVASLTPEHGESKKDLHLKVNDYIKNL